MKKALVTGVGGQDGWYLSQLLVGQGYQVVGCGRPWSLAGERGEPLRRMGVQLVDLDLLDREQTLQAVRALAPDEIYNLAGHSFVPQSWEDPTAAIRITSWPAVHLLDAIRLAGRPIRFYQSSTSEIFGLAPTAPQHEDTPVSPANPYAAAKVFAHQLVALYRSHYGLFACSGILYNHESPRRPPQFVTQKVARAAKRIAAGQERELLLGDLDVSRDWGFAGDFVDAMWRLLQQPEPFDCIIGTGVAHSVRELCQVAFAEVGLDYREFVRSDPALRRPGQPTHLLADPSRAETRLGWKPVMKFEDLIAQMVREAR